MKQPDAATHCVVADSWLVWYSWFDMPSMHVSDQGSHLKDKVIQEFNGILPIKHHMTTAYSAWANGTVEKVNNDIQKLLRSLTSESLAVPFSCNICSIENHDRTACS